ncbi:hypothetical protein [Citricoccus sp. GCM10030269]|uniref:hypothetical protein n=1 Tax=Citricoccus sp. GCM10030269 TaxID=3273388 RepID=UPI003606BEE7
MGSQNVAKAFIHWRPHLSHREMCALLFMSNTALDADCPPVYFAGWEDVARSMDLGGKPTTAKRATLQVLSKLSDAGAITSSGSAHSGVRAEYALNLDPDHLYEPIGRGRNVQWKEIKRVSLTHTQSKDSELAKGVQDAHPEDVPQTHPPVCTTHTQKGVPHAPKRVSLTHTPRSTQEPQGGIHEEPQEEYGISSSTTSPAPAADFAADDDESLEDRKNKQAAALRAWQANNPGPWGTDESADTDPWTATGTDSPF